MSNKSKAKAEVAMMNFVVSIADEQEAKDITEYILTTMQNTGQAKCSESVEEIFDMIYENCAERYNILNMCVTSVHDSILITYILDDPRGNPPLDDKYGVFSYVFNINLSYFSELRYSYFEKVKGKFRKVF